MNFNGEETVPELDSVVLISLPSVTHCYDSNQRYLILEFNITMTLGSIEVNTPLNSYFEPPGYNMLLFNPLLLVFPKVCKNK